MSRKDLSLWAVFGTPLVVGGLSLTGLIGALLDDGAWDWIGSALLGVCVIVIGWALVRRRRWASPAPAGGGRCYSPRRSGGVASSVRMRMASSTVTMVWAWLPRRRMATLPSSASLRPTTAMAGTLATECSRIL